MGPSSGPRAEITCTREREPCTREVVVLACSETHDSAAGVVATGCDGRSYSLLWLYHCVPVCSASPKTRLHRHMSDDRTSQSPPYVSGRRSPITRTVSAFLPRAFCKSNFASLWAPNGHLQPHGHWLLACHSPRLATELLFIVSSRPVYACCGPALWLAIRACGLRNQR